MDAPHQLEATYLLETSDDDKAKIMLTVKGSVINRGEKEARGASAMNNGAPNVDQSMRVVMQMQTASKEYGRKIHGGMWVGTAQQQGKTIIYE